MSSGGWGAILLTAGISLLFPIFIRPILRKLKVLDIPNGRSSHAKPTLRGGGIAPLLGFFIVGIWAYFALPVEASLILAAAVLVGIVGLAEDLRGVRIAVRAALQILIGGALAMALPGAPSIGWIWVPIAAVGFAANVNFTNFMDGVNGISSMHGLVAGLSFAVLGVVHGTPWLVVIGLVVAVSFTAFLPWNLIPPGMFLGDVGSYLLGGVLGATSIAALAAGVNPVGAFAPLSIYWADTVMTLLRRASRGEAVYQPHRSHAYQRLTNTGFSHLAVAGTVAVFTLAASVLGLLSAASVIPSVVALLLLMLAVSGYLVLPRIRGDVLPRTATNELLPMNSAQPPPAGSERDLRR